VDTGYGCVQLVMPIVAALLSSARMVDSQLYSVWDLVGFRLDGGFVHHSWSGVPQQTVSPCAQLAPTSVIALFVCEPFVLEEQQGTRFALPLSTQLL
jgi:hypothetical protein